MKLYVMFAPPKAQRNEKLIVTGNTAECAYEDMHMLANAIDKRMMKMNAQQRQQEIQGISKDTTKLIRKFLAKRDSLDKKSNEYQQLVVSLISFLHCTYVFVDQHCGFDYVQVCDSWKEYQFGI